MAFGDLKKEAGVSKLNEFLSTKSYLEGFILLFIKYIHLHQL